MHSYCAGEECNFRVVAARYDQTIGVSGSGSVLGFLSAGGFGTQSGTITITYTDGTTQTATPSFADWYADSAVSGGTVVATVPWNDSPGSTLGAHQGSIHSAAGLIAGPARPPSPARSPGPGTTVSFTVYPALVTIAGGPGVVVTRVWSHGVLTISAA